MLAEVGTHVGADALHFGAQQPVRVVAPRGWLRAYNAMMRPAHDVRVTLSDEIDSHCALANDSEGEPSRVAGLSFNWVPERVS